MDLCALCGVMVSKLYNQTIVSEFNSHWVPYSSGLLSQLSLIKDYKKKLINGNLAKES